MNTGRVFCLGILLQSLVPVNCQDLATTTTVAATQKVPRSEAFFGIHFDLHPGAQDTILGRDATAVNIAAFLDRVKPDFVQYDCKGHPGYTGYPTGVGYSSPGIVQDALAIWRAETRKRGIGLFIHYSGVWDSAAIAHHPEWAVIQADGKADPNSTSVFSDYAEKLMIPQLKEVTSKYDLDGVWVDGDCWAAKLDYGTTAAMRWKDASGTSTLPRKPGDPLWLEWKAFNRNAFEDYLVKWVDALHEFDRGLQVTSNWSYTPHMPVRIRADVDFLSGDFSAKESVDRARFEARYLASTGKPWDLMAWGFNGYEGGFKGAHQMKTAEQLQQEASVVLALGGGVQVYYQPTRGGYVTRAVAETAGKVADFCRERESVSHKSKAIPQIALLLSTASYLHRSDSVYSPGGQYNALEGALHVLLESGYSVDMLSEHQLGPRMKDFPVVVLAQASVLEPAFRQQLLDYVRAGGTLIFLDRESSKPFYEHCGVKPDGPSQTVEAYVGDLAGTAPVPGEWQRVALDTAETLEYRTTRDGETTTVKSGDGAYGYLKSEHIIAVTSAALGAGAVIAFHGPVSQAYFDTHNANLRQWVARTIAAAFPNPLLKLQGLPYVDVSLRQLPDGREVAHLVNLANTQRANRFATVESIPHEVSASALLWRTPKKPMAFLPYPYGMSLEFTTEPQADGTYLNTISLKDIPVHLAITPEFGTEK